jgi:CRP-like cAMP-binding protein
MNDDSILRTFGSHDFLKGLSPRHLMLLASGARPFKAAPGEYLAREGGTARSFYLIQSGHVVLLAHSPHGSVEVQTVGPGEVVGWSWLVAPNRWQFDGRALDAVAGIAFDAEWLREKCEQDYHLGYTVLQHLITVLAGRLAATRRRLTETSRN